MICLISVNWVKGLGGGLLQRERQHKGRLSQFLRGNGGIIIASHVEPATMTIPNESSDAIQLVDGLLASIDMKPIENLLESARNGFRLFELFRLTSVDQLIEYFDIEFESHTPQKFSWWYHFLIEEQGASHMHSKITDLPWRMPWHCLRF